MFDPGCRELVAERESRLFRADDDDVSIGRSSTRIVAAARDQPFQSTASVGSANLELKLDFHLNVNTESAAE